MKRLIVETKNSRYFITEDENGKRVVTGSTNPNYTAGTVYFLESDRGMRVEDGARIWRTSPVVAITEAEGKN